MQSTVAVKRPGPPVPPRPKTTTTATVTATTVATSSPPIIQKKPTFVSQLSAVGRTLVYKSPSLNLNQKKQAQTQTPTMALVATATTIAATPATPTPTVAPATAPKPPLKLRKAPAVPTAKPRDSVLISVNRANSLSSAPVQATPALKDTRLSLGKVDFERAGLLPTSQPLPKPRKIVQLPVATLDMDEEEVPLPAVFVAPPATPANGIFRRSKTTLDSPISSHGGHGSYLGGKTVELKNNLKNAAERLFSEIIISQSQKQSAADTTIITKHERAIQHQALLEQELELERHKRSQLERERARCEREQQLVTIQAAGNCTRININNNPTPTPQAMPKSSLSAGNTPVKKHAFHEMLISELAAMRNRSCSLEQLPTIKSQMQLQLPIKTMPRPRYNSIEDADMEDVDADNVEDADGDGDEEDTLTYAINKSLKENNNNNNNNGNLNGSSTPRKRCPSGCSSDSSPYGTERSQRIRTSDWIEVGDNGKQVTLTSCHISLEDSGMEDEERLDDMSSSGVGDSWDSVKEAERENEKRCRNVKRSGMSISGLPPLPKSLSGFNKLLGSDSGLLSDVEAQQELENNNNDNKENESGNKLASQIVSDNKSNNNNNNNSDKQASKDSSSNSKDNANNKSAMAKAESATATPATAAAKTTTTILATHANETENKTTATKAAPTTTATILTTLAPSSPAKINVTGSTLDAQIATLRKEMYGLRQLDLSLLSQLWALNDSIQEFRTMIEEQDDEEDDDGDVELDEQGNRRHSPTPSSYDSVSSEGGAEDADLVLQAKAKRLGTIPKVITTQPKQQHIKADVKPVPRMRSAPPPPPPVALICTGRKAAAPPRPT